MRFPGRSGGQSTVEYAVVIVVVITALLSMATYMKRGAMGKLRESTDSIGVQFTPLGTTTNFTRVFDVGKRVTQNENGSGTEAISAGRPETRKRSGDEQVQTPLTNEQLFP